jgi:ATP phosphoribosyltransferase regulatory subunit
LALKDRFGRVPPGVRDLLPAEAGTKREIETKFAQLVHAWGYQEVSTPIYEYYENILVKESSQEDKLFKFLDRNGHLLVLRPDMTLPIARLAATGLKTETLPLRLFYTGHAFLYESPQAGRQREFYQAGVEILGDSSADADAETVILAVKSLLAVGIQEFQISLGHVGIFHGLADDLGLPVVEKEELKTAIGNKDFVLLRELLSRFMIAPADQSRLLKVLNLRGSAKVLVEARQLIGGGRAQSALDNLEEIYAVLQAYGVESQVALDFGLLRELDYYTGAVFEGYTGSIGFPLCGGGRYDNLTGQFGHDLPATGFALGVDKLMLVLDRQGALNREVCCDYLIRYTREQRSEAVRQASELRQAGYTVTTQIINSAEQSGAGVAAKKTMVLG